MTAVELAPGVYRLPTMGDYINSFAFVEPDGSVTLVDCGTKRAPRAIVKSLQSMGKSVEDVQRIVMTHAHNDHAGGLAEMVDRTSPEYVMAHVEEKRYLESGIRPPINTSGRLGQVFARASSGSFAPTPITDTVDDGDVIDVAGGLSIHHTPGHTPGHISLRHESTGVLITGDAIFNMASRMTWPVSFFCTSPQVNQRSAALLADLEYDVVAFTHGPEIRESARETVRGFLMRKGVLGAGDA